jgi:hypothetical protein
VNSGTRRRSDYGVEARRFHAVTSATLPDDARRINALTGGHGTLDMIFQFDAGRFFSDSISNRQQGISNDQGSAAISPMNHRPREFPPLEFGYSVLDIGYSVLAIGYSSHFRLGKELP